MVILTLPFIFLANVVPVKFKQQAMTSNLIFRETNSASSTGKIFFLHFLIQPLSSSGRAFSFSQRDLRALSNLRVVGKVKLKEKTQAVL